MRGLKTGYVFVMTTLLTLAVVVGIAAFYPAPKRYDSPTYPRTNTIDYNSPEYKAEQQRYQDEMKSYDEKNKDVEGQRKIWGEKVFITNLAIGVILLIGGVLLLDIIPMIGVACLFAAFVLMVFGPGLTSYYADNTPYFTTKAQVDLSSYKQIQFVILLAGTIIGTVLGFLKFKPSKV